MGYTHGKKWNDEKIKQHVLKVIESNNLDRMPSQKECITYYGDCSLANAVARRYGKQGVPYPPDTETRSTLPMDFEQICETRR